MQALANKFIVGLTGGIGSGKSTVSALFEAKGIDVVDADVVAREVVQAGSEGLAQVSQAFGNSVLATDGSLDRAALRLRVFSDTSAKNTLNSILHPLIRKEMLNQLQNTRSQYCILSAPLLFENNLQEWVNRSLAVDLEEGKQKVRAAQRDGNIQTIEAIMAAQVGRKERVRLADDLINNDNDQAALVKQVDELHKKYLHLSSLEVNS